MNNEHERYRQIHAKDKFYFYLNSDTLDEDINWANEHQIENIRLSQYDGYKINTIDPIFKLRHIKSLVIFIDGVDLNRLAELDELEDLSIGEQSVNIDLTGLVNLKSLYVLYYKNIKGLNTLVNLEKLIVVKGPIDFFKEELFAAWPNLKELALLSPKLPDSLSFMKNQRNLKEFEIFSSRSKFDVSDLKYLRGNLETLKIGNCKRAQGLEDLLPLMTNLRWLAITESVNLADSTFVDLMSKLEVLVVYGSSYFENGDISNLKRLKHVSIDDKKHYNLKSKDFVSQFKK